MEKTFSTMHASNVLLQQQYRQCGFKKYSDLINVMLVAEKNNELLMRNHNMRPPGAAPYPEANAVNDMNANTKRGDGRKNSRGYKKWKGRGNDRKQGYGKGNFPQKHGHPGESSSKGMKQKVQRGPTTTPNKTKSQCYRCGMTGHWAKVCRTAKHLCELYQASQKEKGKDVEANFATNNAPQIPTLDLEDMFANDVETGDGFPYDEGTNF